MRSRADDNLFRFILQAIALNHPRRRVPRPGSEATSDVGVTTALSLGTLSTPSLYTSSSQLHGSAQFPHGSVAARSPPPSASEPAGILVPALCQCCGIDDDEEHCWRCSAMDTTRQARYDSLYRETWRLLPDHRPSVKRAIVSMISAMPFYDVARPSAAFGILPDQWQDCLVFDWRLANIGILPDSLNSILGAYFSMAEASVRTMKPDRHTSIIIDILRRQIIYGAIYDACERFDPRGGGLSGWRGEGPPHFADGSGRAARRVHVSAGLRHQIASYRRFPLAPSPRVCRRPDRLGEFADWSVNTASGARMRPAHLVHPWS